MRIYSDHLTAADIAQAIRAARDEDKQDIYLTDPITAHKSRKRHASFVVFCHSAHGRYATAHRPIGSYPLDAYPRSASWDAYGYMMARLFAKDPDAIVGWYDGVHDFRRQCSELVDHYRRAHGESSRIAREHRGDFLELVPA